MKEVKIGNQTWMAENLNVATFSNGDAIIECKTADEWYDSNDNGIPAWSYYDNDTSNGKVHGRLYNWFAVSDPRGLAPEGWRIAAKEDYEALINFLGGSKKAARKLKSKEIWNGEAFMVKNAFGTDDFNFGLLPSGLRDFSSADFCGIGTSTCLWTATPSLKQKNAMRLEVQMDNTIEISSAQKSYGYSVRCLK